MFYIQDFKNQYGFYIVEWVKQSIQKTVELHAFFAFVSTNGIKLLFEDSGVLDNHHSSFHLTIGIDAITNQSAIDKLKDLTAKHNNFHVKVFYDFEHHDSIFHPKFIFLKGRLPTAPYGDLIIGSCNLTVGGIIKNIEALVHNPVLDPVILHDIESRIQEFNHNNQSYLFDLDSSIIANKIKQNEQLRRSVGAQRTSIDRSKLTRAQSSTSIKNVLLAEIPGSGNKRWQQANFDQTTLANFFMIEDVNKPQRPIYLIGVDIQYTVYPVETRPLIIVASSNYRFELGLGHGIPYPSNGKPIAIFIREQRYIYHYIIWLSTSKPLSLDLISTYYT